MVHLDPTTYMCPTHKVDLTAEVQDEVEETFPPVAFSRRKQDFEVIVSCPGDHTADNAHRMPFVGWFWR
jgi:hypothetical protein